MRKSPHLRRINAGFTLVEVLLALLVLALAMTALHVRIGRYLADAAYLREKTVAGWVALNQLELLRLSARRGLAPPALEQSGSVQMANATWYWYLAPEQSPGLDQESTLVPVRIQVSNRNIDSARTAPLITLTGVTDAAFSL